MRERPMRRFPVQQATLAPLNGDLHHLCLGTDRTPCPSLITASKHDGVGLDLRQVGAQFRNLVVWVKGGRRCTAEHYREYHIEELRAVWQNDCHSIAPADAGRMQVGGDACDTLL
jgi:hypothetical protein